MYVQEAVNPDWQGWSQLQCLNPSAVISGQNYPSAAKQAGLVQKDMQTMFIGDGWWLSSECSPSLLCCSSHYLTGYPSATNKAGLVQKDMQTMIIGDGWWLSSECSPSLLCCSSHYLTGSWAPVQACSVSHAPCKCMNDSTNADGMNATSMISAMQLHCFRSLHVYT